VSTRGRLSALLLALLLAPGEGTYAQECPKQEACASTNEVEKKPVNVRALRFVAIMLGALAPRPPRAR
jgi:hypothetical protein